MKGVSGQDFLMHSKAELLVHRQPTQACLHSAPGDRGRLVLRHPHPEDCPVRARLISLADFICEPLTTVCRDDPSLGLDVAHGDDGHQDSVKVIVTSNVSPCCSGGMLEKA